MQNQGGAKKKKKKLQRLTGKSGGAVWSTLKLESRFLHRCSFDPVKLWRFVYIFFYSFSPFPPLKERQEQSDKLGRKLFYFILNWDCCFRSKWCWQETHQEQSWLVLFSEVLAGLLKCRSPETNFTSSSGLDVFCALDVKSRLFISWMGVWVQALRWEQTSGSRGITCYWVKSVLFFFFFLACKQVRLLLWNGAYIDVYLVWNVFEWRLEAWGCYKLCVITLRLSVLLFFTWWMHLRVFDTEMWPGWMNIWYVSWQTSHPPLSNVCHFLLGCCSCTMQLWTVTTRQMILFQW